MERKIGEIFEYNGEWYQCVKSPNDTCLNCDMKFDGKCPIPIKECLASARSDLSYVIFKKLKKVGEPYVKRVSDGTFSTFQKYRVYNSVILPKEPYIYCNFIDGTIEIEIKQNKEDMSNTETLWYGPDKKEAKSLKLSNLKSFSLEAAKAGKPVCTRDGRKAKILCYDFKQNEEYPILVAVENKDGKECALLYSNDGISDMYKSSNNELVMFSEKKEGWVNVYRDCDGANITKDDNIYSSKDAAIACAQIIDRDNYVATTIIKWKE